MLKPIIKTATWVVLAIFFIMAGGSKLLNPDTHAESFSNWGYPLWFLYVTGLIEVGGAIGLLIPATRLYATLVLGVTMLGAAVTHLRAGEMGAVPVPLVLLGLLMVLAWTLRPSKYSSSNSVS